MYIYVIVLKLLVHYLSVPLFLPSCACTLAVVQIKVYLDADGKPLSDEAQRLAEEEEEIAAKNRINLDVFPKTEEEEDNIMVEDIQDPVKLKKSIDA